MARSLGLSRQFIAKLSQSTHCTNFEDQRKQRKDAISIEVRNSVTEFYKRDTVSSTLPDARSAAVKGGEISA